MLKVENDISAEVMKEVSAMTDRTLETRNRIIEAMWRAIVKDDEVKPEDGKLIIQKNIRTEKGQEETRYNFMYKGEFVAGIIERQNYCDYSYFLTSDKINMSELMQKITEVTLEQEEKEQWRL
mgnify:CR=1 FL=1